jgi:hypothetical protein
MAINKYIMSIGFEVECGINCYDRDALEQWFMANHLLDYFDYCSDGSVHVKSKEYQDEEIRIWHYSIKIIKRMMRAIFDIGKISTNCTCGFHIHIVIPKKYEGLTTYGPFVVNFINAYKTEFGHLRRYEKRLHNSYCNPKYDREEVIMGLESEDKDSRYWAINFNSIPVHETLEFRIFPAQRNYKEFIKTFNWFRKTVASLISKMKQKRTIYLEKIAEAPSYKLARSYKTKLKEALITEFKIIPTKLGQVQALSKKQLETQEQELQAYKEHKEFLKFLPVDSQQFRHVFLPPNQARALEVPIAYRAAFGVPSDYYESIDDAQTDDAQTEEAESNG